MRLAAALLVLLAAAGARGEAPKSSSKPSASSLSQIVDAQRALSDQIQQVKEQLDWTHWEIKTTHDEQTALVTEVKALRDEVKGLYVESSTLRQQLDALKEDIAGVDANVTAFRNVSGYFIAAMIVALALILVMTIRR
jgi:septal ring factor EnvC (AmiA/AmiB activator)